MPTNPVSFAQAVLNRVGAPVNHNNIASLVGWARAEGGASHNNPFNTTENAPGAATFNSVGVKSYVTPKQAVNATVRTLNNGRYNEILNALRTSNPQRTAQAIGASPWGTSGSLVSATINDALKQNFGVKSGGGGGSQGLRLPGAKQITHTVKITPPKTSHTSIPDYAAAGAAAFMKAAQTPITVGDGTSSGGLAKVSTAGNDVAQNVASELSRAPKLTFSHTTPGHITTSTQITQQAVNDAQAAGANADAQKLLRMVHRVAGTPYAWGGGHATNSEHAAAVKQGVDCSGFVSWLMGRNGLGIWSSPQTTETIPHAQGIEPGRGHTITILDNAAEHVIIKIGDQWWGSEGGVGVHQIGHAEVNNYLATGAYKAYHPKGL